MPSASPRRSPSPGRGVGLRWPIANLPPRCSAGRRSHSSSAPPDERDRGPQFPRHAGDSPPGPAPVPYDPGVPTISAPRGPSDGISRFNRVLAPLALLAVLAAIFAIVVTNTGDSHKAEQDTKAKIDSEGKNKSGPENPKTYVVEEGDTLSGIAAKFDVSVKRLERLNPDIDPQTIGAGQELKIR